MRVPPSVFDGVDEAAVSDFMRLRTLVVVLVGGMRSCFSCTGLRTSLSGLPAAAVVGRRRPVVATVSLADNVLAARASTLCRMRSLSTRIMSSKWSALAQVSNESTKRLLASLLLFLIRLVPWASIARNVFLMSLTIASVSSSFVASWKTSAAHVGLLIPVITYTMSKKTNRSLGSDLAAKRSGLQTNSNRMIGAPVSTNACMWSADATYACPSHPVTKAAASGMQHGQPQHGQQQQQQLPTGVASSSYGVNAASAAGGAQPGKQH